MSVCGQSGQAEDDSCSEEVTVGTSAARDLYKQKPASKVVRVLTVLAYLLSVSLAAILLSVYYVCVWKSPELPPLNDTEPAAPSRLSARRGDYADHPQLRRPPEASHNFTGGGGSTVIAAVPPTPATNIDSLENTNSTTEATSDLTSTLATPVLDSTTSSASTEDYNNSTGTASVT